VTHQVDLPAAREICPTTTRKALAEGALLVDVREASEVAAVAFADCDVLAIPLSELETRWSEIPRDRDVVFACAAGVRSLKATYFLMYQGYDRVANMKYGMQRWIERGFPVHGDPSTSASGQASSCCCGDEKPSSEASCGCDSSAKSKDAAGTCC
jgi:rhodanese-related sulfurtransferase